MDPELYPVRGSHLVTTNPGLTEFLEADIGSATDLLAIYPYADHMILGGTAQPYVWGRDPDEAVAAAILERCTAIEPQLASARIVGHRIGLRPTRAHIRLEAVCTPHGRRVNHCSGHGGAGVSLAWGCAGEVASSCQRLALTLQITVDTTWTDADADPDQASQTTCTA